MGKRSDLQHDNTLVLIHSKTEGLKEVEVLYQDWTKTIGLYEKLNFTTFINRSKVQLTIIAKVILIGSHRALVA